MWCPKAAHVRKALPKTSGHWPQALLLGIGLSLWSALPVAAAEKIFFQYGALVRSVRIDSIETLANQGVVEDDLAFYINLVGVSDEELARLRESLQQQAPIDPVLLSRFLYTDIGEELLARVGEIVRTRSGFNGETAIRAALINAAMSPEGLTALNVLRNLPIDLQIDVTDVLALENAVNRIIDATASSVTLLANLTQLEASTEPAVDYSTLPALTQPGRYQVTRERWPLVDASRDREFYVDIVRPQPLPAGEIPVVVVSHGLAASPESWRDHAVHLASYGFLVALPQHPGSDAEQTAQFQRGLTNQIFDVQDFINRPLDISFVLDELERRNRSDYDNRLALTNVGVAGHSFGGYTALAVAGATINFDYLATACTERFQYLNISLLLQCQALRLPPENYQFRDPRVTSIMVTNPVNSSVFGPSELAAIDIPVLIMAGSYDPATPAVFEQFRTFPWFSAEDRYLALIEGQAHVDFSELDAGVTEVVRSIPGLTLAPPELINRYVDALGLAYFQRYTAGRVDYRVYLRSSYATYLSQDQEFKLYLVTDRMADEVAEAVQTELNLPMVQVNQPDSQPTDD